MQLPMNHEHLIYLHIAILHVSSLARYHRKSPGYESTLPKIGSLPTNLNELIIYINTINHQFHIEKQYSILTIIQFIPAFLQILQILLWSFFVDITCRQKSFTDRPAAFIFSRSFPYIISKCL